MQHFLGFQNSLFLDGLIGISINIILRMIIPCCQYNWTYIYDNTLLEKTLEKYIDFKKLSPDEDKVKSIIK